MHLIKVITCGVVSAPAWLLLLMLMFVVLVCQVFLLGETDQPRWLDHVIYREQRILAWVTR